MENQTNQQQPATSQQVAQPQYQEVTPKKSRWWIWLIVAVVIIVIGIVAYVILTGDSSPSSSVGDSASGSGGILSNIGGSIPQPPALPE